MYIWLGLLAGCGGRSSLLFIYGSAHVHAIGCAVVTVCAVLYNNESCSQCFRCLRLAYYYCSKNS